MGSMKKFVAWLSGEATSKDKDRVSSTIIKLKLLNKRLARQVSKMETSAKINRNKAVKARESGNMSGSKMLIKASLQAQKQAHVTDSFRIKIEGIQYKLEQAKAMNDFSGVAKEIAQTLGGLQTSVNVPQLNEMVKQMDAGFENFDIILDSTSEQLDAMDENSSTGVEDKEVNDALAEIDAEISLKTGEALPSTPISEDLKEDIGSLEEEIKKLKEQKNN